MGYTTDFDGSVQITPPLNPHEIAYLLKFSASRRMARERGPYFVDGSGFFGQDRDPDITDYNQPPPGQPELWCQWEPTEDGSAIQWNGTEKFYSADEWMAYLIDTFLKPGAALQAELANPVDGRDYPEDFRHFTFDHDVNGVINAQGEDAEDKWRLVVTSNAVAKQPVTANGSAGDGITITRDQLEAWAGRSLTDDEVYRIGKCIPNSSIPEAIDLIAGQFGNDGEDDD